MKSDNKSRTHSVTLYHKATGVYMGQITGLTAEEAAQVRNDIDTGPVAKTAPKTYLQ